MAQRKNRRLRRVSAFGCFSTAILWVILFNLVQEPLLGVVLGGFAISDFYYLAIITAGVIVLTVLVNLFVHKVFFNRRSCPNPHNPTISWEWALFSSSVLFYPASIKFLLGENLFSTVISFSTTYPLSILFAIAMSTLWLVILRTGESASKRFSNFLNRFEIVTTGETARLIVLSAVVGVTIRALIDVTLHVAGFPLPPQVL